MPSKHLLVDSLGKHFQADKQTLNSEINSCG